MLDVIADAIEAVVQEQRISIKEKDLELQTKDSELKSLLDERDEIKSELEILKKKEAKSARSSAIEIKQLKAKLRKSERTSRRSIKGIKELEQEEIKRYQAKELLLKKKLIRITSELQELKDKDREDWGGNNMDLNRIKEIEELRKQLKERDKVIAKQQRQLRKMNRGKEKHLAATSQVGGSGSEQSLSATGSSDWSGNNMELNRIRQIEGLHNELETRDKVIARQQRELRKLRKRKGIHLAAKESGSEQSLSATASSDWTGNNIELNRLSQIEELEKKLNERDKVIVEQERESRKLIEKLQQYSAKYEEQLPAHQEVLMIEHGIGSSGTKRGADVAELVEID